MQIKRLTMLGAAVLFSATFILTACSSNVKTKTEVTLKDIKVVADTPPPPPPPPPPLPETIRVDAVQKCFQNEGLKYSVSINMFIGKTELAGQLASTESGSEKVIVSNFSGTIKGDKLNVTFEGNPPVIGDASDWTDKPWTLKKSGKQETLLIIFNAKNYETNKWEEMKYEFTGCKNSKQN